jgi:surface antigen/LysM repeat protein
LLALRRYITHFVVLAVVLVLSGYATVDHQLPSALFLRLGAINAQGLVMGQGGSVNGVNLGRMDTIVAPLELPTSAPVSHTPVAYVVGKGETLSSIASKFRLSTAQILWSNPGLIGPQKVSAGERLVLPPVPGVVVLTKPSDTLAGLSNTYHVTPQSIVDFNYLRSDTVAGGWALVLPGGRGAAIPAPNGSSYGGYSTRVGGDVGSYSNGQFPYGYCTWYVATKRHVYWSGNAWQWWPNARAAGRPEGQMPRVGAIMVTWESSYGHVAYVEQVNSDGSWVVSEMNFVAWGVVDHRTIRPGQVPLIGFIY